MTPAAAPDSGSCRARLTDRVRFVREHTQLARVPFVPELALYTATEVTPLWQATSSWLGAQGVDVPFWSVPWAGGQGLARWVLDNPTSVRGLRVLDFGSGSGLVAIAAARAGAARVLAVDIDPFAEAACALNAEANASDGIVTTCADLVGTDVDVDVVLAGDVWYEQACADRVLPWFRALASAGVRVLTGDPGRSYVPQGLREMARYDVPTTLDLESVEARTTRVLELARDV